MWVKWCAVSKFPGWPSVQLCSWLLDGSADSHTLDQQPIAQPAFLENTIEAVERLVWEEIVDCFPFENGVWCSRLDRHISPFVEKGSGENFYVGKLLCFHLSFLHHLKHELKSKNPASLNILILLSSVPHHFVQTHSLTELSKLCGGKMAGQMIPETNRCLLQTTHLCLLIISFSVCPTFLLPKRQSYEIG